MILLNKNNLRIAQFCAKEASRYTLQMIQVSKEGTCATDGMRLVRVSLPQGDVAQFPTVANFPKGNGVDTGLLSLEMVKKLEKRLPTKSTIPILLNACVSFDEESAHAVTTDLDTHEVLSSRQVKGQFPNVEAVLMNNKEPKFSVCLDPEYLADLAKSAEAHGAKSVKLKFYDAQSAIRLDAVNDEGQTWTGLLMPRRD